MHLKGTVVRVSRLSEPSGEVLGALTLSGDRGSPDAEVSVTRRTRLLSRRAPLDASRGLSDVGPGQRVTVVATEVQETYPVRAVALEVRLDE